MIGKQYICIATALSRARVWAGLKPAEANRTIQVYVGIIFFESGGCEDELEVAPTFERMRKNIETNR